MARRGVGRPRRRWTASTRRPTSGCSSTSCSALGPRPTPAEKARGQEEGRGRAGAGSGRARSFDKLAVAALGGSREQGRQRLSAAEPARAVRAGVRQRRLGARAGPGERPGGDAVRLPHHQAADAGRGARITSSTISRSGRACSSTRSTWTASPPPTRSRCCRARRRQCGPRRRRRTRAAKSDKALVKFTGGELTVQELPPLGARAAAAVHRAAPRGQRHACSPSSPGSSPRTCCCCARPTRTRSRSRRSSGRRSSATTRASSTRSGPRWGCRTGDVTDSSIALAERKKVAGLKVEKYFDGLIDGKTRLRPLPSALATLLRDRLPYAVHDAGVNRAVELASELKAKADSAGAAGSDAARAGRAAGAGPAARAGAGLRGPRTRHSGPRTAAAGAAREASVTTGWRARPAVRRAGLLAPVAGVRLAAQDSTGVVAPPAAPPVADSAASRRRPRSGPPRWRHSNGPIVVDRVVAIVGNRPVLSSQVDEEVFSRQSQGQPLPKDPDSPRRAPEAGRRLDRRRGAAGPAGAARHRHQGHRPGDRGRRRAAGPEGPGQFHFGSRLQERAQARPASARPRSTGAG